MMIYKIVYKITMKVITNSTTYNVFMYIPLGFTSLYKNIKLTLLIS